MAKRSSPFLLAAVAGTLLAPAGALGQSAGNSADLMRQCEQWRMQANYFREMGFEIQAEAAERLMRENCVCRAGEERMV